MISLKYETPKLFLYAFMTKLHRVATFKTVIGRKASVRKAV